MTRADVLKQFGINKGDGFTRPEGAMADEILRLRAILAALREPSDAILEKAWSECPGNFPADHNDVCDAIRAAVAAAEREVAHDTP